MLNVRHSVIVFEATRPDNPNLKPPEYPFEFAGRKNVAGNLTWI
jgi:hypothetical protein